MDFTLGNSDAAPFIDITSVVIEKLSQTGEAKTLAPNDSFELANNQRPLLSKGSATLNGRSIYKNEDYGARPFAEDISLPVR
jgi:hypothetical protein